MFYKKGNVLQMFYKKNQNIQLFKRVQWVYRILRVLQQRKTSSITKL